MWEAIRRANPQMLPHQVEAAVYVMLNSDGWDEKEEVLFEITNGAMGHGGASTSDAAG